MAAEITADEARRGIAHVKEHWGEADQAWLLELPGDEAATVLLLAGELGAVPVELPPIVEARIEAAHEQLDLSSARLSKEETLSLPEFLDDLAEVRETLEPGSVSWAGSPWGWLLHNGPVTKNKLGRGLALRWLRRRNPGVEITEVNEGTFGSHFVVAEKKIRLHFGLVGKEGEIRFSSLLEPGAGCDYMILLGIEPRRARWWVIYPRDTLELPCWRGDDSRMHSLSFDVDKPPEWLNDRLVEEILA